MNSKDNSNETWAHNLVWTTLRVQVPRTTIASCYQGDFPKCDPILQAAYYITLYGTYLSYVIGIPGSFLTCVVLTRMRPFNSSLVWFTAINLTGFFNLSLRFSYSVVLTVTLLDDWSCKFLYLMTGASEYSTHLFLVGLTIERFIAVWFPLKMAVWCSIRRTVYGIIVITIIGVGQCLYVIEVYRLNGAGVCVLRAKYKTFWESIYENYICATEFILIPILVVIVLNILITNRLKRAKLLHQRNLTDDQSKEKRRQQSQINQMLIAASISSVVFLVPDVLYRYIQYPLLYSDIDGDTVTFILTIMGNLSGVVKVYKYAANFIVYSLAARRFRMGLLGLFLCGKFVSDDSRWSSWSKRWSKK